MRFEIEASILQTMSSPTDIIGILKNEAVDDSRITL